MPVVVTDLTVLKLLAAGRDPAFVADATGATQQTVHDIALRYLCVKTSGDINTTAAQAAADRLDKAGATAVPVSKFEHVETAVAPTSAPSARTGWTVDQVIDGAPIIAAPAPKPETVTSPPRRHCDHTATIKTGRRSSHAATRRLADRAETILEQLKEAVGAEAATAELELDISRLTAELAAKKTELAQTRNPRRTPTPRTVAPPTTAPKTIRAWAAANNIPCSPHGKIPGAVADAYTEAHKGTAA